MRPASFLTLEPGTPVVDRLGRRVGEVRRVLLHEDEGFDGIIVTTPAGKRFVDAPEVRRIFHGAVTLGVSVAEVLEPGPAARRRHGVPEARHGAGEVTEADRDAAIEILKRAYVSDQLTTDELGDRVVSVHSAETLDQLDSLLDGLSPL